MEGQEKTVRGIKTFLKTLVTVELFIIYVPVLHDRAECLQTQT